MKALVTGSAGFIGYHLAKKLVIDGWDVVGLDSLNDYYQVSLKYDRLKAAGIDKDKIHKLNFINMLCILSTIIL